MYINIGSNKMLREQDIVGIFDLDSTTISKRTRAYLSGAEKNGMVENIAADLPKSFVVEKSKKIYLSQLSTTTLNKRIEDNKFY